MAIQHAFESNESNTLYFLKSWVPERQRDMFKVNTPRTSQEAVCPTPSVNSITVHIRFDFSHHNGLSGSYFCLRMKQQFCSAKDHKSISSLFQRAWASLLGKQVGFLPSVLWNQNDASGCPCKMSALSSPGYNHLNTWKWCLKRLSVQHSI